MKKKIIYFLSVGRSDFQRLLPIIQNLNLKKIDYKILISGAHYNKEFGNTWKEIKNITKACYWSSLAHKYTILKSKPGLYQYQLVNYFKSFLADKGIDEMAYIPVCSSGKDNKILHYTDNNKKIRENTLVLMDIGCKYNHYCSDITRTFPISGTFTKKESQIYMVVLKTQLYGISLLKPNKSWKYIEDSTRIFLYNELSKIGIINKQPKHLQIPPEYLS